MWRSHVRSFATRAANSHHNNHHENHKFLSPHSFVGSWKAPRDPKEAEAQLAQLRREYAKQVKEVRKEYIVEVEAMRLEKQRKDEARKEALRVANEERKKLKAQEKQLRAQERNIAQQQFRQTLVSFLFCKNLLLWKLNMLCGHVLHIVDEFEDYYLKI